MPPGDLGCAWILFRKSFPFQSSFLIFSRFFFGKVVSGFSPSPSVVFFPHGCSNPLAPQPGSLPPPPPPPNDPHHTFFRRLSFSYVALETLLVPITRFLSVCTPPFFPLRSSFLARKGSHLSPNGSPRHAWQLFSVSPFTQACPQRLSRGPLFRPPTAGSRQPFFFSF